MDETGSLEVSILKRGHQYVAPEPVFFRASLIHPDIPQAHDRGLYDESFHRVLYVWDFGDPGAVSDKVVNLPARHNDLNRAYGKEVAHVFTRPGRHTISCTAYGPDGDEIGRDETEIEVAVPDLHFGGEKTIVFDPDGRGDPVRYPEAQVVTEWRAAWAALQNLETPPGRILIKRGLRLNLTERLTLDERYANAYVAAWGEGDPPVLVSGDHELIWAKRLSNDIVFQGIHFEGPWDSTTETGAQHHGFMTDQDDARCIVLDDCRFSGFRITLFMRSGPEETGHPAMFAVHNCDITNWGDYGAFYGANVGQFIAFLGTAIHQHPQAMMGGGGRKQGDTNQHGPIRLETGGHCHISACDMFSRNGWSMVERLGADQPCLRWSTHSDRHGPTRSSCNIERTAMEGGFEVLTLSDENNRGEIYGTNFVMDKCLIVGTARTWGFVNIQFPGTTLRNSIMVRPNSPMLTNVWDAGIMRVVTSDRAMPFDLEDPVEIYNNTVINLMDDTNRDGQPLAMEDGIDLFETFSFENNVSFTPNSSQPVENPDLSLAPMPTVGGVWTSRYFGARYRSVEGSPEQLEMDYRFATPDGAVGDSTPLPNSPVIDDASGRVAVDDFWGRTRGEDPDRGAIEA